MSSKLLLLYASLNFSIIILPDLFDFKASKNIRLKD